ncbi:MAG TPA: Asp-tRNA(Asn)/Glu-tRNA(Gln) amidotransferase subunit GatC [Candidatus Binatia bacterium]|jgi:aspartyl-tRNA(Asn)/glutamyl-tRNA(Gln) amidotransferase subunit C
MAITREEVQRIALLARLRLTGEEESLLTEQLGKILEYITVLQRLDTTGIEPMAHALDVVNAMRDDRVTNEPDTEALLANAPATDGKFFQVPKIIE